METPLSGSGPPMDDDDDDDDDDDGRTTRICLSQLMPAIERKGLLLLMMRK